MNKMKIVDNINHCVIYFFCITLTLLQHEKRNNLLVLDQYHAVILTIGTYDLSGNVIRDREKWFD